MSGWANTVLYNSNSLNFSWTARVWLSKLSMSCIVASTCTTLIFFLAPSSFSCLLKKTTCTRYWESVKWETVPSSRVLTYIQTLCDGLNNVARWECKDTRSSSNRCKSKSCHFLGCRCQDHNNIGFGRIRFRSSLFLCIRRPLQCVAGGGETVRHCARTCSQHTRRCVHIYTLLRGRACWGHIFFCVIISCSYTLS